MINSLKLLDDFRINNNNNNNNNNNILLPSTLVEFSTLTRENGATKMKILGTKEVEALIQEHEQVKAEEAKKTATKK